MIEEIWKDIDGYEGQYQISSYGRCRSCDRYVFRKNRWGGTASYFYKSTVMKLSKNNRGYIRVRLSRDNNAKTYLIHRLVAQTFIPNPNNYSQVNHKDENKTNNNVKNLEWCTNKYNLNYGTRNKRAAKTMGKKVVCVATGEIFNGIREASRKYNIDRSDISKCCQGKRKTAGGYKWEYFKEEI